MSKVVFFQVHTDYSVNTQLLGKYSVTHSNSTVGRGGDKLGEQETFPALISSVLCLRRTEAAQQEVWLSDQETENVTFRDRRSKNTKESSLQHKLLILSFSDTDVSVSSFSARHCVWTLSFCFLNVTVLVFCTKHFALVFFTFSNWFPSFPRLLLVIWNSHSSCLFPCHLHTPTHLEHLHVLRSCISSLIVAWSFLKLQTKQTRKHVEVLWFQFCAEPQNLLWLLNVLWTDGQHFKCSNIWYLQPHSGSTETQRIKIHQLIWTTVIQ